MTGVYTHIGLDTPAEYRIKVQGRFNADFSDWFAGQSSLAVETAQPGDSVTTLTGTLADQASLHGLLGYIRNLGLVLLYVDCLSANDKGEGKE